MGISLVQFLAPDETALSPIIWPFDIFYYLAIYNRLQNRMSFSKTSTSSFLSILKVLKLISFFSLEIAIRRVDVITRSERDRMR